MTLQWPQAVEATKRSRSTLIDVPNPKILDLRHYDVSYTNELLNERIKCAQSPSFSWELRIPGQPGWYGIYTHQSDQSYSSHNYRRVREGSYILLGEVV